MSQFGTMVSWTATLGGVEYGFADGRIIGDELAEQVEMLSGREVVTTYGKPFTVDPADAEAVLDVFRELFDPSGEAEIDTVVEDDEAADEPEGMVLF